MASTSLYLFPQEGLDYALNVFPRGTQTVPTNLYLGLFTTAWSTIEGYSPNINVQLNTGTYAVTELGSATGYSARYTIPSTAWQTPTGSTVVIGSNTINTRSTTTSGSSTTITFVNGAASSWSITGMFLATSATVGQASGAGTTVLWYSPWSDQSTQTVAPGDSITVVPYWASAPYPA